MAGRRTARFSFQAICGRAYGPADYIELARIYHVIFIEDIPKLDMSHKNEVNIYYFCDMQMSLLIGILSTTLNVQVRRLITLIDALYEHKVLVHVLADAPIFDLFLPSRAPVAQLDGNNSNNSISDSAGDASEADAVQSEANNNSNSNSRSSNEAASDSDSASMNVARLQHDEVS